MLPRLFSLCSALGVLLAVNAPAADAQRPNPGQVAEMNGPLPLRIMCVGASITMGQGVNGGYRLPLEKMLQEAGIPVQFVGRQQNNSNGMDSPFHEGYPGHRIDQVENGATNAFKVVSLPIAEAAQTFKPDVVLLFCGTNDVRQNYRLAEAPQRFDHLISSIQAADPGVRIIASSLSTDRHFDDAIRAYNAGIAQVIAKRAAAGQKVSFVDSYAAVNPGTDMSPDLTHPNPSGYAKIARTWFQALAPDASQVAFAVNKEGANQFAGKSCLGYQVTMKRTATVRDLGVYTDGQPLTEQHAVGIYDTSGKLLASVQIEPSSAPVGSFVYHSLTTPLRLEAGRSYLFASNSVGLPTLVGTQNTLVDPVYFDDPRFYFDHNVAVSMDDAQDGTVLKFPGTQIKDINGGLSYYGPSFRLAP